MMHWSEIEKVTLAFGYGLSATPIQLAQAYSILANGGVRQPLTLLKQDRETLPLGTRVVDAQVAQDVLQVLGRVTGSGGTATLAQVPGFSVGGRQERFIKSARQGIWTTNTWPFLWVSRR